MDSILTHIGLLERGRISVAARLCSDGWGPPWAGTQPTPPPGQTLLRVELPISKNEGLPVSTFRKKTIKEKARRTATAFTSLHCVC